MLCSKHFIFACCNIESGTYLPGQKPFAKAVSTSFGVEDGIWVFGTMLYDGSTLQIVANLKKNVNKFCLKYYNVLL